MGQSLLLTVTKDGPTVDNSETVYISSLALLKMLKHGRAGVPMEVVSFTVFFFPFTVLLLMCYADGLDVGRVCR